ncbi:unnamed protein product [Debaryomyces fabryi]|nr:unnamed protein product [Debaryomyces fabryi]
MNFNFLNDSTMATPSSFLTEEFFSSNEDLFGTIVESCFKTIDTSQKKYHSQGQGFTTFSFNDFVEEKPLGYFNHDSVLDRDRQPRSYEVREIDTWENNNKIRRPYTFAKKKETPKELFDRNNNLVLEFELEEFTSSSGVFEPITKERDEYFGGTRQNIGSFIKQEANSCFIDGRLFGSELTDRNEEDIFTSSANPIDLPSFSQPCNKLEDINSMPNYTYSNRNQDIEMASPNIINPSFIINSCSASVNCQSNVGPFSPEKESMYTLKNKRSRFIKGSKNRPRIQREFSYDDVDIESYLETSDKLINVAKNEEPYNFQDLLRNKLLELKVNREHSICCIKRNRYVRKNLDSILNLYKNVGYELNPNFHISKPYEPQYVRFEIDETNDLPFNETRCGLCPYCPDINFKNLKTSTYSQHLALTHGVYTDNYLTPNPLYYGIYIIKKTNTRRRTKAHEHERCGVVCPCCYAIVGTECSKTTASSKPLNNYMRHFKEYHRQSKDKLDPIKFFNKTVPLN